MVLVAILCQFIWMSHLSFTQKLAKTPPRGWNSYDSYGWIINETEVLQNAQAVAKYLHPHGYNYIVIDYGWFVNINNSSEIYLDAYGRPQPDPVRYPHSINGTGLKWLADQIHSMGLLFGIHTSRGVSDQAYYANLPIYQMPNSSTKDIGLTNEECPWGGQPFMSINMSHIDGQTFYNSLYLQYTEWGIDFIKNDCVFGGNAYAYDQILGVHKAIQYTNKSIIYSISAGDDKSPSEQAEEIYNITNMYRTTGDDWDIYNDILLRFNISAQYANDGLIGAKSTGTNGYSWPDADMLPFGYLTSPAHKTNGPYRWTQLSAGQQRIQMVLWSIIRSPLFFGGVVMELKNDSFTLDLLTNKYCLDVNIQSTNNRQIAADYNINDGKYPSTAIWAAQSVNVYYVAFFNLFGHSPKMNMSVALEKIVVNDTVKSCKYQNAFDQNDKGTAMQMVVASVPINDTVFYALTDCV
eukprot:384512_1